ncbi:MAG: hypothetical protein HY040_16560 [Planctomycetes bacterium]|nr:hypothetical protein [Planctomycetota bacterium]
MFGLGAQELLLILILSAAGQSVDAVSLAPPSDYFQTRGIASDFKSLADVAGREPKTGKDQIGQLMALRLFGEEAANWKKDADYARGRKVVEDVAAGRIALDKHGFAKKYAERALALADGKNPPADPAPGKLRDEAFSWFPASATLVGALDTRLVGSPQSTRIGYDPALFKLIPKNIKEEIYKHLELLGNVQIDRVAFAFAQKENRNSEIYVRVSGKVSRSGLLELFKSLGVETKEVKGPANESILVHDPQNRPPVVAFVGDTELLLVGYENNQGKHGELIDKALAIRDKKQDSVAKGKLQADLVKVPDKACGLLLGSFPDDLKQVLGFVLGAQPEGVAAHVTRSQNALDVELKLAATDAQQAMNMVKSIANQRDNALNALKMIPPMPDFPIAQIQNLLQSIQIQADGSTTRMQVLVPDELMRALPKAAIQGLSGRGGLPPAVEKEKQEEEARATPSSRMSAASLRGTAVPRRLAALACGLGNL